MTSAIPSCRIRGKISDEKLELACCGNPYQAVQNRAVQSFCLVTAEQPRPDRQALGLRSIVTLSDYRSRGERTHRRRYARRYGCPGGAIVTVPNWMIGVRTVRLKVACQPGC